MSTTIQIKRSSTASAVPLSGDLAVGELAVNLADKRLFAKQADGTIIELSTNPTDLDAATLRIDGVEITASATELNSLDGLTATTAELNILDGVTATATEINVLDGITSTTTELNKLDGFTGSTAELNILDGVTATTAELNFVDGVTSNVQTQLNAKQPLDAQLTDIAGLTPIDGSFIVGNGVNFVAESGNTAIASLGVTATAAELNTLDGVTATTTELNYTDGVTSNIQTQLNSKAATTTSPTITLAGDLSGSATLTNLGNATLTATVADDSHNHVISNVDGLQTSLDSKANLSGANFTGSVDVTGTITADGLTVEGTVDTPNIEIIPTTDDNNAETATIRLWGTQYGTANRHSEIKNITDGSTASNELAFDTNGSERLRLHSNGDVSFYEDTGTTAKMVWDASAESLGIGTSAPYGNIHLAGGQQDIVLTNEDADGVAGATIGRFIGQARGWQNEGDEMASIDFETNATSWFKGDIVFKTNNVNGTDSSVNATERMRIDSSGNVGIGTASPSGKLEVNTGSSAAYFTRTAGDTGVSAAAFTIGTTPTSTRLGNSGDLTFKVGSVGTAANLQPERARIDSSGNLLVGTTSTSWLTSAGHRIFNNGSTTSTVNSGVVGSFNRLTNDGEIFQFRKDGGKVGSIGASQGSMYIGSDDVGLLFRQSLNAIYPSDTGNPFGSDGVLALGHQNQRFKDLYLSGGVITSSDYRLKEDVQPMQSYADTIKQMNLVNFAWKDSGEREDGFIAHELQALVPSAVRGDKDAIDEDGNEQYQGVDPLKLIPVLTKALQEALERIETLENK